MYRRTCGKIVDASDDLSFIQVRIKFSYKNVNYNGSMFGGSLFGATDPIYMIQYLALLEEQYVIWDKSADIRFKKPAREDVWINFEVKPDEIEDIKKKADELGSFTFTKEVALTNKDKSVVFAVVNKEIYIATKAHYKQRQQEKKQAIK